MRRTREISLELKTFGGALEFKISKVMDAKTRIRKKHSTTFDYEKEMEKALSKIFSNLRGIEENRFRIASNQCDPTEQVGPTTSEPSAYIELSSQEFNAELQEQQEQVQAEKVANSKSRRRLPELPKRKIAPSLTE